MQGTFPFKVPNHLQTPLHWKLLTQGSSLLVEKLERNTDVCEARHFGLKGALASASSWPVFSEAVLDAFFHALQSPEAAAHFCWFGVSLQVSNCIATGIVPKNFCWLGKRKHVSMTTYLHDLRGYHSSRFPIANYRKSPFLENDGGRIQHLYIPSFDPCSYGHFQWKTVDTGYSSAGKRYWVLLLRSVLG